MFTIEIRVKRGSSLNQSKKVYLFIRLLLILLFCFKSPSLLIFYCFFELSLVPIFLIVLGWGYQPERLQAGMRILFYTLFASLPLLASLLVFSYTFKSRRLLIFTSCYSMGSDLSPFILTTIIIGFLVKLPIFIVHLWLPRAHVEAPVFGSMILAGVLLKLGVFGLLIALPLINPIVRVTWVVQAFACVGGALVRVICVRISDIKTLIAYSSVAHMGILCSAIFCLNSWGVLGRILISIAHGVRSSGLFWGSNVIYLRSSTRRVLLNKRTLNYLPVFSLFWFIFCLGNMGGPPTLNLVSEVYIIVAIFSNYFWLITPCLVIALFSTIFTLNLYISTQHGQTQPLVESKAIISKLEILCGLNHSFMVLLIVTLIFLI